MTGKNVILMEFEQNPNIGLYMFVNDKFCLVGKEISESKKKEIEKTLGVKVYHSTIVGTDLLGVFITGNNDIMMIPDVYDYEMEFYEKLAKDHDMKLLVVKDKLNTLGNNIAVGDKEILINPHYEKKVLDKIKKDTGYEVIKVDHEEYHSIGSLVVYMNGKYFVSQEFEEKQLKKILDKIGGVGTVNSGSNYIASGIVGNENGVILGSVCTTIEIQNIVEALDYL